MHRWRSAVVLSFFLCVSAASSAVAQGVGAGDWTMPSKDYAATRFSELAQITSRG